MSSVVGKTVSLFRYMGRAGRVLASDGPRAFMGRVAAKLAAGSSGRADDLLVRPDDALAVDLTAPHPAIAHPLVVADRSLNLAWISSPPGRESGGHHNMFRFIKFAQDAGHRSTVYLYDGHRDHISLPEIRDMLRTSDSYPNPGPTIRLWEPETGVDQDTDAIFATGWETAYPAYRDASPARRFYFVQDYEPLFYPTGSQALLAENTYRFGFHGITAGGWLSERLATEFGMPTDHFDFAADTRQYQVTHDGARPDVFFYARPVTARRAFELGVLALSAFAKMRPEARINLAGWDVSHLHVPFRYVNHSSLNLGQLNTLYNSCATGLVLSLTNLSLLPLELLAAGVTPVLNDGPNNRKVTNNPRIHWTDTTPSSIARGLVEAYDAGKDGSQARANAASVGTAGWAESGAQFVSALERVMRSA